MAVITFDFDDTIVMSHMLIEDNKPIFVFDGYNDKIIELIQSHIEKGDDIHIVTARSREKEDLFPNFTVPMYLDKPLFYVRAYSLHRRCFKTRKTPRIRLYAPL